MELGFKPGAEAEPEILNIAPLVRLKEYLLLCSCVDMFPADTELEGVFRLEFWLVTLSSGSISSSMMPVCLDLFL